MIFGNKKQKEKRTLKEYGEKKVRIAKAGPKRTKDSHFFSQFMFYFLILIFFGTAGYLVFFSGFLTITRIEIQKNEIVKSTEVQKIVDSELEGKYFNFLEKNNLILLSNQRIRDKLLANFKIIGYVGIKKIFPDGIEISITERKPQIILSSARISWVIDEKGEIFDMAEEDFSYLGQKDLPVIVDESDKEFSLGNLAIDEKYISFISDFRKKIKDSVGIEFDQEIQVPSISSGDMRMKTKEGWMIFLDANIGVDKERDMLQAVLDNKIEKEKRPNLEYVDLRILNKVFYKFKDGTLEVIAKEAADKATQDSANIAPAPTASALKKDDTKKKK
jgi:cell division septal protein FtsQ